MWLWPMKMPTQNFLMLLCVSVANVDEERVERHFGRDFEAEAW